MVNPFKDTNWNPGLAERRDFARSLMIGFPIIAVVLGSIARLSKGHWSPFFLWLAGIGFALGLLFWLIPQIAKPFYLVWYFVACCMGIVISNVLLAGFYYLLVTPTGLLLRLFGHDPMRRNFDPAASTYWIEPDKAVDPKRYFRQF